MPVRRTLQMDSAQHHPASKIPVPARNHAPLTKTASSPAGKTKVTKHEQEVPQREFEKLDSLRSKLEQSVDAFIKARKELEEILSADGSSEQGRFLTGSSADLKTELRRHRELTFRAASSLVENKDPTHHSQGKSASEDIQLEESCEDGKLLRVSEIHYGLRFVLSRHLGC